MRASSQHVLMSGEELHTTYPKEPLTAAPVAASTQGRFGRVRKVECRHAKLTFGPCTGRLRTRGAALTLADKDDDSIRWGRND